MLPSTPTAGWPPFVVAALVLTATVGALTGAIDLWHLRVGQQAVPLEHHRGHALAQLFGFVWLFTVGMSLHLVPRLFGASTAGRRTEVLLRWTAIPGVLALIGGQLGALMPGSRWVGLLGALLLVTAMTTWAVFIVQGWNTGVSPKDSMHLLLLAGTAWWWLAAVAVWSGMRHRSFARVCWPSPSTPCGRSQWSAGPARGCGGFF